MPAGGRITGRERSDNPADVARACHDRDLVMAYAIPLDQFATVAEAGRATRLGNCRRGAAA